jgi:hypothetical protein
MNRRATGRRQLPSSGEMDEETCGPTARLFIHPIEVELG